MNCRETARLLSGSLEDELPFVRKTVLRMHLFLCRVCRRHGAELREWDHAVRKWSQNAIDRPLGIGDLPDASRARLRRLMAGDPLPPSDPPP